MGIKDDYEISGGKSYLSIEHKVFPRVILIIDYIYKEPPDIKIRFVDKCSALIFAPVLNEMDEIVKGIEKFRKEQGVSSISA